MTARRTTSPTNPSAWQALREFLVDAYSNQEMRLLLEFTLLAEAGSRLPDERVSPQEFAANLCALIQRHSGHPVPEFWRQLAADRPLRAAEIAKLKQFFTGVLEPPRPTPAAALPRTAAQRLTAPRLVTAALIVSLGSATTYCALAGQKPRANVVCRDGTPSPTCDERRPGCCSNHGGVATE